MGELLLQFLKPALTNIIADVLFVIFGIWILLPKEDGGTNNPLSGSPFISIFGMISIAEIGDKTRLTVITLVAKYGSSHLVFTGAVLALATTSLIGIFVGKKLRDIMPLSKIKLGAGAMFILFGILFLTVLL